MAVDSLAAGWAKALSVDRKQFNLFFEKMMDGFSYHRIVVDKKGKPIDYIFLEVNDAFEKMTGLRKEKILGKKVTEVLPGIEKDPADWIGVYGKVALTGEPVQFENQAELLGKWYNVSAYCPEKGYFVALFEDITERKNVETTLKATLDRFYKSLSNMHGAILLVSSDGLVEFANQSFCDYFNLKESPGDLKGLSSEKMIERIKNGYVHPDQQVERIKEILASGKMVTDEEVEMQGNRTCLRDFIPIYNEGKSFSRLWHHIDITERKKAEKALRLSEAHYRTLFSSIGEGFELLELIFDGNNAICDLRYLEVNDTYEKQTGLRAKDVLGKTVRELFPKIEGMWIEVFDKVIKTGQPTRLEDYHKDTNRYYSAYYFPFGKNEVGVLFSDITERKEAEEALKASEEKANQLIKYAPSGIYELDYRIPPKFRSVNDAMCQILGYTREELLATSPFALLDDESQRRFRERIMKMLAGEKVDETVEFKVIPKDGREIYAVLNTTFTYKNGKPDGALVIAHDVTERKKAERALEKRAKNLESLVEERTKALRDSERLAAIGATAGMVGHDIRNPLQAIISDVYLAKTELASISDSEEKKNTLESLQEIEKNVDYINKIVADLQDFVKPLNPHTEETDLQLVIRDLLSKNSLPKNINVSVKVDDEARKIVADATFINRILYNLVTNAVQAMPNGGELKIHASKEANDVIMTVKDTGVGIPEKAKGKLFTPLFTTKSKGQGFGLAVVKRMTESLGGTVTFESEEGKGTTFFVRLPFKKDKNMNAR